MALLNSFIVGFFSLLLCHLVQVPAYFIMKSFEAPGTYFIPSSYYIILGFGVTQLFYLIPLLITAAALGYWRFFGGIALAGLATFLINVVFFIVFGPNMIP